MCDRTPTHEEIDNQKEIALSGLPNIQCKSKHIDCKEVPQTNNLLSIQAPIQC